MKAKSDQKADDMRTLDIDIQHNYIYRRIEARS